MVCFPLSAYRSNGGVGAAVNVSRRLILGLVAMLLVWPDPSAAQEAEQDRVRLMILGDSLTHGYGLPAGDTFPAQLEAALQAAGLPIDVINAGVSGDTSAGGLARLDWALADAPDAVMIELGANDALRGIDPAATRDNLGQIIEALQARDLPVLLTGMLAPRNYDAIYIEQFDGLYLDLASNFEIPLYPFFLEGVALDPALNQADGIHPNAEGVAVIVQSILPFVVESLEGYGLLGSA